MRDPSGPDDKSDSPPAPAPVNALQPTIEGSTTHPIVCLECNHPLLFLKKPSKVVRIDGHTIKG